MFGNCKCHVCGALIPLNQPIYCYDDNDGVERTYDLMCWKEQTIQGIQGYKPTKIYPPIASAEEDEGAHGF